MGLVIHYSTPSEVQSGTINVAINFTDSNTNNPLFVKSNSFFGGDGTRGKVGSFKLIDSEGNNLPPGSYSIDIQGLKNLSWRNLTITLEEGVGTFSITTQDDFQVTGYEIEHPTITTSGGISMQEPQTSRPINYKITEPKTTDTPPESPDAVEDQPEPELEDLETDNTGPEQTQLLAVVDKGGTVEDSGSEKEPELLPLNVAINHLFSGVSDIFEYEPGVSDSRDKIIVWFTWYFEGRLAAVQWHGPLILSNVESGGSPEIFGSTLAHQRSAVFSRRIRLALNSRGEIVILIQAHSATFIYLDDNGEEIQVTGPPSNIEYTIDYNILIEDTVPPSVRIIRPRERIISTPALKIRFKWSEDIKRFRKARVITLVENFSGEEIYLEKGTPEQIEPDLWEIALTFSRDGEEDIDPFRSSDVGVATIRVEPRAGTDLQGLKGPTEPEELKFNYDFAIPPPGTVITDKEGNSFRPVCRKTFSFQENPFLDKSEDGLGEGQHVGGGFVGVSDLTIINQKGKDYLFGVAQIARKSDSPRTKDPLTGIAGGSLFQLIPSESDNTDCSIDIIKAYDRYPAAARSLVEYDKKLYFYEGSHYSLIFERQGNMRTFSDRDTDWRPHAGRLRSFKPGDSNIKDKDPTSDHGNSWRLFGEFEITVPRNVRSNAGRLYEEEIFPHHKGTSAPMLVVGNEGKDPGDLYLYSGLGNLDDVNYGPFPSYEKSIEKFSSTVLDNWILLKYSEQLEYRVPVLNTNGIKGYDILNELAKVTGSYVGASESTIFYLPKYPRRAKLDMSLNKDSSQITYRENSREFPDSGLLLIETIKNEELIQEIIKYDGHIKDNQRFESLERKQYETNEDNEMFCPSTTDIYYINYVLDMDANYYIRPINEISYRTDFNQLYNQFTLRHSTQNPPPNEEAIEHYIENKESVLLNGGKELEIEVPSLDERYQPWIEWLGEFYTDFYSNLHYLTNLTVVSSFHFKLGDTVLLRESELSQMTKYRKLQVLNISQNKEDNTTRLQLRTL